MTFCELSAAKIDNVSMTITCIICHLGAIPEGSSKGFAFARKVVYANSVVVLHKGSDIFAYRHRCPYTGGSMEWQADQFLDDMDTHSICGIRGIRFLVHDSFCRIGSCPGRFLTKIAVDAQDDGVVSQENLDFSRG